MFCFNFRVKNMTQMWLVLCEGTEQILFSVNKSRDTASYSNTCSISELQPSHHASHELMRLWSCERHTRHSVRSEVSAERHSGNKQWFEEADDEAGERRRRLQAELEPSYLRDSRVTVSSGDLCLFMNHYFSDRHVWVLLFSLFNGLSQSLTHNAPAEGDRDHRSIHQSINQSINQHPRLSCNHNVH